MFGTFLECLLPKPHLLFLVGSLAPHRHDAFSALLLQGPEERVGLVEIRQGLPESLNIRDNCSFASTAFSHILDDPG